MKTILLLAFIGLATAGQRLTAGTHNPIWNTGQILLNNGTQIAGEISYNWKAEIVQLRQNGMIKAYSSHQVANFSYFDRVGNALRQFSAVNYPVRKNVKRPVFLEQFAVGPMTIYRRLRHMREPLQIGAPGLFNDEEILTGNYDNFSYHIYVDGQFVNMDKFQHELWPQMQQEFGPELKRYADTHQLDNTNTVARLMLINQYNYLKAGSELEKTVSSE